MRRKRKTEALTPEQWRLAAILLKSGRSVQETFEQLNELYPGRPRLDGLCGQLGQGRLLEEILDGPGMEREIADYLGAVPLAAAITVALEDRDRRRQLWRNNGGRAGYAAVLLLLSAGVMMLFSRMVLPAMSGLLEDSTSLSAISRAFVVLEAVLTMALAAAAALCLLGVLVTLRRRQTYWWMALHRLKADRLIRLFVTYRFASLLDRLLRQGVALADAVQAIRVRRREPLVSLLAYHFDEDLIAGTDFAKSLDGEYFDDAFHPLCLWGLAAGDFSRALEDYLTLTEWKCRRALEKGCALIQGAAYGLVGLVIVLSYQVLFLPLSLLEQL